MQNFGVIQIELSYTIWDDRNEAVEGEDGILIGFVSHVPRIGEKVFVGEDCYQVVMVYWLLDEVNHSATICIRLSQGS
jgi:hypothetical protein